MNRRIPLSQAHATGSASDVSQWLPRSQQNRLEPECWPKLQPTFAITPGATVFTIGSCFARNIEQDLQQHGFHVPMLALGNLSSGERVRNFSNKYTPASIQQELQWVDSIAQRDGNVVEADVLPFLLKIGNDRFIDIHLYPAGPAPFETVMERRRAVYETFSAGLDADVSVITLGLIEAAFDRASGLYVPIQRHLFLKDHQERFAFEVLDFQTCLAMTRQAIELLQRRRNQCILLTTSPVPMSRTFAGQDIMIANMYSKSVLRAVAGEICAKHTGVDYFPSYESVMLTKQGYVWDDDLLHVSPHFVRRIVRRVVEAYVPNSGQPSAADGGDDVIDQFCARVTSGDMAGAQAMIDGGQLAGATGPTFHFAAALLAKARGRKEHALEHARQAASTEEGSDRFPLLADVFLWAGKTDEAVGFLGTLMARATPAQRVWYYRNCKAFLTAPLAVRMFDDHLQANTLPAPIAVHIADALEQENRLDDAIKVIDGASAADPGNAGLRRHHAALLTRAGRPAEAIAAMQSALQSDPNNANALLRLGRMLLKAGDAKEAAVHLQSAATLAPTQPPILIALALAHEAQSQYEQAFAQFMGAKNLDPANATIDVHLNRIRRRLVAASPG